MTDTAQARADPPPRPTGASDRGARAQWGPFALVCLAYLAVTTGEQGLSPVMPAISDEFGTSEGQSGLAFGLLALSIALANVVAGAVLGRFGARALMLVGMGTTAAGAVAAALSPSFAILVASQVLLGAGAGLYFPAGLQALAFVSGPGRRGLAMGLYGVAFSGGLLLAALLGALGAASGWRVAFWCAGGLAVLAAAATWTMSLPPPTGDPIRVRFARRAVAGLPTFIGGIAAICQYGAIPFLTTFAVDEWGLKAAQAAALLAVGRVLSIVAKLISGAGMDRSGPIAGARWTGFVIAATGLAWVVLPAGWPAYVLAAIFAGSVSSLGPIANFVAVDHFGNDGPALGAFRSTQIGIGAAAGWLIGRLGEAVGLRWTLLAAVLSPLLLVFLLRPPGVPRRAALMRR